MSMLKDELLKEDNKNTVDVVTMLTKESGYNELKQDFDDLQTLSVKITNLSDYSENLLLTNESAIATYLQNNGYEEVTSESAMEKAKEVYEKIKKVIKELIDKFIILYNKVKIKIMEMINNINGTIKSLISTIKALPDSNDPTLLNNDTFKDKLPLIRDFSVKEGFIRILKELGESLSYLNMLDTETYIKLVKATNILRKELRIPNLDGIVIKYVNKEIIILTLDNDDMKMKFIKTSTVDLGYDPKNKKLLNKEDMISILSLILEKNNNMQKVVSYALSKIEKIKSMPVADNKQEKSLYSSDVIVHNVSTMVSAINIGTENYIPTIKAIMSVVVENIKCYK